MAIPCPREGGLRQGQIFFGSGHFFHFAFTGTGNIIQTDYVVQLFLNAQLHTQMTMPSDESPAAKRAAVHRYFISSTPLHWRNCRSAEKKVRRRHRAAPSGRQCETRIHRPSRPPLPAERAPDIYHKHRLTSEPTAHTHAAKNSMSRDGKTVLSLWCFHTVG